MENSKQERCCCEVVPSKRQCFSWPAPGTLPARQESGYAVLNGRPRLLVGSNARCLGGKLTLSSYVLATTVQSAQLDGASSHAVSLGMRHLNTHVRTTS